MAVEPRLLNPTDIVIAQKNETTQQYDHLRRGPANIIQRDTEFTIKGQVKWNLSLTNTPEQTQTGVDEEEKGYFIVLTKDLAALGKEIKRGDLVKKFSVKEVNFYVLRIEYGAHYGGEFKMAKVVFADRDGQDA